MKKSLWYLVGLALVIVIIPLLIGVKLTKDIVEVVVCNLYGYHSAFMKYYE